MELQKKGLFLPFFFVSNANVYATFDAQHLLTSFRNNFCKYDVKFLDNKQKTFKEAKWRHITELCTFDKDLAHRIVPKFIEQHTQIDGFNKMKVSLAAQVFRHSMSSALLYFSMIPEKPASAEHTAEIVNRINFLFDSVNRRVQQTNFYLSACSGISLYDGH